MDSEIVNFDSEHHPKVVRIFWKSRQLLKQLKAQHYGTVSGYGKVENVQKQSNLFCNL